MAAPSVVSKPRAARGARGEAGAEEEGAVEAELPEHVGEEADARHRGGDAAEAHGGELLAVEEDRIVVEPAIGGDVVGDPREHLRERAALAARRQRAHRGANAAIGHAPEVGQHGADRGVGGAEIAEREVMVKEKVHVVDL